MKNERDKIRDFAQHIFNLGLSYGANFMTLDEVEKYKGQMIDDFYSHLDLRAYQDVIIKNNHQGMQEIKSPRGHPMIEPKQTPKKCQNCQRTYLYPRWTRCENCAKETSVTPQSNPVDIEAIQ